MSDFYRCASVFDNRRVMFIDTLTLARQLLVHMGALIIGRLLKINAFRYEKTLIKSGFAIKNDPILVYSTQ